jgi:hypothetical protein
VARGVQEMSAFDRWFQIFQHTERDHDSYFDFLPFLPFLPFLAAAFNFSSLAFVIAPDSHSFKKNRLT